MPVSSWGAMGMMHPAWQARVREAASSPTVLTTGISTNRRNSFSARGSVPCRTKA